MPDKDPVEIGAKALEGATWQGQERAVMRAIIAALSAEGFAVVPREPTREMYVAGGTAFVRLRADDNSSHEAAVWAAMLAAAERESGEEAEEAASLRARAQGA